ncbi:GDSL esterase/lipase [Zancudomyces culisetae]|uniref:GDSL esterase/lipase n=1 Tax=Zancudomyces culisetae TaxID=1213189 RepID=A0A1R1PLZ6_ZANCU|nr:GDSL esterase/lipase [Zancudomyces culisetae]|eukprot:OMH81976.1 GDSL esterase/lipase [Zancudomyces culisetae]
MKQKLIICLALCSNTLGTIISSYNTKRVYENNNNNNNNKNGRNILNDGLILKDRSFEKEIGLPTKDIALQKRKLAKPKSRQATRSNSTQPYLVVFGDSLSDNGNQGKPPSPDYWYGRYSNGPVWCEYFAHFNNYTVIDYAYAGATTVGYDKNGFLALKGSPTLPRQVDMYVEAFSDKYKSGALENDIVAFQAGSNNIVNNIINIIVGTADIQELAYDHISNVTMALKKINTFGYKKFLVFGIPSIAHTPLVNSISSYPLGNEIISLLSGKLNAVTDAFNNALNATVNTYNSKFPDEIDWMVYVDLYGLTQTLFTTDVIDNLLFKYPRTGCDIFNLFGKLVSSCVDSNDYGFMDNIHPSTRIHALLGIVVHKIIENPQFAISRDSLNELIVEYNLTEVSNTKNILFNNDTITTGKINVESYNIQSALDNIDKLVADKNKSVRL